MCVSNEEIFELILFYVMGFYTRRVLGKNAFKVLQTDTRGETELPE